MSLKTGSEQYNTRQQQSTSIHTGTTHKYSISGNRLSTKHCSVVGMRIVEQTSYSLTWKQDKTNIILYDTIKTEGEQAYRCKYTSMIFMEVG